LEAADGQFLEGRIDLSALEELLDQYLAKQLLSAYEDAKNPLAGLPKDRKLH
jgi:hypothetical protein